MTSRPKSLVAPDDSMSSSTSRENTYTPIEAMNGFSGVWPTKIDPAGMLWPICKRRCSVGFSSNAMI